MEKDYGEDVSCFLSLLFSSAWDPREDACSTLRTSRNEGWDLERLVGTSHRIASTRRGGVVSAMFGSNSKFLETQRGQMQRFHGRRRVSGTWKDWPGRDRMASMFGSVYNSLEIRRGQMQRFRRLSYRSGIGNDWQEHIHPQRCRALLRPSQLGLSLAAAAELRALVPH